MPLGINPLTISRALDPTPLLHLLTPSRIAYLERNVLINETISAIVARKELFYADLTLLDSVLL